MRDRLGERERLRDQEREIFETVGEREIETETETETERERYIEKGKER